MALEENISAEDVKVTETLPEPDSKPFDIRSSAKKTASKIMSRRAEGLPKKWKGRGDYYFERLEDGGLKITGGNDAQSLTGGESTILRDPDRINKIFKIAAAGDIVKEGATYQGLYDKGELKEMVQKDPEDKALYSQPELQEMVQKEPVEPAYNTKEELREMVQREPVDTPSAFARVIELAKKLGNEELLDLVSKLYASSGE